jgi:hypothetical protein
MRCLKQLHKKFVRNFVGCCLKFFCPIERNNLTEKVFENSIRRVNTILALRLGAGTIKTLRIRNL